ncbi:MAG: glycosyltransferase family 2 protein [Acidobacteriaceae bacterium]|nr:glycosyltransferase family 2 protein [Acidobacteriaceae bacterium]
MSHPISPKVYVILVNWNGWRDTIECLESLFHINYPNYAVLVCDNGSTDGSLKQVADWARGGRTLDCTNHLLESLVVPPHPKPIHFATIEVPHHEALVGRREKLFLIQTGANLGFAGGNNVGLRLALGAGDLDYAWLLNNDTVVDRDALTSMVKEMEEAPAAGMCGSVLLSYNDGRTVQAAGGYTYNRWTARVGHIGCGLKLENLPPREKVERELDYVAGASMLVRRRFLEQVGPLNENYFLFFEEIDWVTRAKRSFSLIYSPGSIVYHKEGQSTGMGAARDLMKGRLSRPYGPRSRILFTRTHYPIALISVIPSLLAGAVFRLLWGKPKYFKVVTSGLISGMAAPVDREAFKHW